MDRRTFLRVVISLSAAATVPVTFLVDAKEALAPDLLQVGLIRETISSAIEPNCLLARFDVLMGRNGIPVEQFSVDFRLKTLEEVESRRQAAKELIEQDMADNGFTWRDLIPLPAIPRYRSVA
ncbi:MAG: hypothetical protein NUV75_05480 [Gallionella sp.]|nr:hypothetical protein [Gallionella sp.]